jgi:hypothetical protein
MGFSYFESHKSKTRGKVLHEVFDKMHERVFTAEWNAFLQNSFE